MNTDRITSTSRPFRPTPTPPGLISPELHVHQAGHAAQRRVAVVHRVDGAVRRTGRRRAPQRRRGRSEPHLLALGVAARRRRGDGLRHPPIVELRSSRRPRRRSRPRLNASQMHGHDRDHRVALALVLDHPPERERERERDDQDRVELEEVADAGRVRERVRGVDVEEVAAVRSQLLDRLHARVRPAGDLLRGAGNRVHLGEAVRVLDDAGGERARSRTRRRAEAGCGRSCARDRPRSCRSCAARHARARGSARPSPPCPRRRTRTAGPSGPPSG